MARASSASRALTRRRSRTSAATAARIEVARVIILALDTATPVDGGRARAAPAAPLVEARDDVEPGARPRHAERVLELAAALLAEAGLDWAAIDAGRRRRRPGRLHGPADRARDARAASRARAGARLAGVGTLRALAEPLRARAAVARARRPSRRGLRRRVYDGRRRAARAARLRPGGARRAARGAAARSRWPSGTGRYDSRRSSRRAASPSRRPTARCHRVSAAAVCRLAARAGPLTLPSPTTCGSPDAERAQRARHDRAGRHLEIRVLAYSDLPAVAAIERRAFPTPWSIAMFVLELSKPTGALPRGAARRAARRLHDLLALRHRLARDEHRRRPGRSPAGHRVGAARRALRARRRRARAVHARGPPLQPGRDRPLPARRLPRRRACAGATTRTTARTR